MQIFDFENHFRRSFLVAQKSELTWRVLIYRLYYFQRINLWNIISKKFHLQDTKMFIFSPSQCYEAYLFVSLGLYVDTCISVSCLALVFNIININIILKGPSCAVCLSCHDILNNFFFSFPSIVNRNFFQCLRRVLFFSLFLVLLFPRFFSLPRSSDAQSNVKEKATHNNNNSL